MVRRADPGKEAGPGACQAGAHGLRHREEHEEGRSHGRPADRYVEAEEGRDLQREVLQGHDKRICQRE
eukprot:11185878-Lingulodinium_polyedra.AAC.1